MLVHAFIKVMELMRFKFSMCSAIFRLYTPQLPSSRFAYLVHERAVEKDGLVLSGLRSLRLVDDVSVTDCD